MADTNGDGFCTIEILLPTEIVERARERATRTGRSLDAYLADLVRHDVIPNDSDDALSAAIKRMTSRTPAEIQADREAVLKTSRKARPLPEGKTLFDVVEGTWPGEETDEEIREMLEKLS